MQIHGGKKGSVSICNAKEYERPEKTALGLAVCGVLISGVEHVFTRNLDSSKKK